MKNEEALLGMGQAFAAAGDLAKAIYYVKRLRRYHPKNSKALQALIKHCVRAGEPEKAEAVLREEINTHPDRLDTFTVLARFYGSRNEIAKAHEILEKLFLAEPGHIEGMKVKASLAMKEKKYPSALEEFRKINASSPDAGTLLAMAECLQQLKKIRESIPLLYRVIRHSSQHPVAFFLLARAFKKSHQLTKALLLFQVARRFGAPEGRCLNNIKFCHKQIRSRRNAACNSGSG